MHHFRWKATTLKVAGLALVSSGLTAAVSLSGSVTGAAAQPSQPTPVPASSNLTATQLAEGRPPDGTATGAPGKGPVVPSGLKSDPQVGGSPTSVTARSHLTASQLAAPRPGDLSAHGASPNSATDSLGCPAGYACAWVNAYYSGGMGEWAGNNADWYIFPENNCYPPNAASDSNGTWYDCASSIDNNGTQTSGNAPRLTYQSQPACRR